VQAKLTSAFDQAREELLDELCRNQAEENPSFDTLHFAANAERINQFLAELFRLQVRREKENEAYRRKALEEINFRNMWQ